MKFVSIAVLAGVASASIFARETCNADDCARQVRVTQFNDGLNSATQIMRSVDCSTFLLATLSTTVGGPATIIRPSAVPTYASSCTVSGTTDFARYSSACVNCDGVLPSTTTVLVGCNADLCSRGLFGTRVPAASVASNTDACKSFLLTTVSTVVDGFAVTNTPTMIPTAATSSCTASGTIPASARFSSACNCASFFSQTTTVFVNGPDK